MEYEDMFLELCRTVAELQDRVTKLERQNAVLIQGQRQLIDWNQQNIQSNLNFQNNVGYELHDWLKKDRQEYYPNIRPAEDAIDKIVNEGKSLARFGDGEFTTIAGRVRHRFQNEPDEQLGQRLKEVLQSDEENLLIGIADNYGSLEKYTEQAKREIRCYLSSQVRKEHLEILSPEKTYYDAYVTRPYVMYADNQTDAPAGRFKNLSRIWANRKCIIVEGSQTRMGVGNDLFDSAAKICRILAPAENAFRRYSDILECCFRQPKDSLFLLALGPTATVLAYDLCKAGYQAVDVGHVDLEYEWFLRGEGTRTIVAGKYNNEIEGAKTPAQIDNKEYWEQVLEDFS